MEQAMKNSSMPSDFAKSLLRKFPLLLALAGLCASFFLLHDITLFIALCAAIFVVSIAADFIIKSDAFFEFAQRKFIPLASFIQKRRQSNISESELHVLQSIEKLMADVGQGLFENRLVNTPESSLFYKIAWLSNDILDQIEAMSREIQTAVSYAGQKKYFRRALTDGLRGEFSIACIHVNQTIESIADSTTTIENLLHQIEHTSRIVASSSAAIATAVEEMSSTTAEQSNNLTSISHSTKELHQTSASNSENLQNIASLVQDTARAAGTGNDVAAQTHASIQEIVELTRSTAKIIGEFENASQRIAESARMIYEIADQTNLLALNAAIEAARAGEYGRGFAVVADEVRKLAEKTQQTTADIAVIIKQINVNAQNSVQATARSLQAVEKGLQQAERVEREFSNIFKSVQEVERITTHIAAASEEQTYASSEISDRIGSLMISGRETALATESVAESVTSLNGQIESLVAMSHSLN